MKSRLRLITAAVGIVSLAISAAALRTTPADTAPAPPAVTEAARVVGPGRVEPVSEEIGIGVEVSGRVARLAADEGDAVAAGQVLAELENRDYRAAVASATARLDEARAALLRVRNGARTDERREASAAVAQAEAVLAQADREAARRAALAAEGVVAWEEADRAARDRDVARARLAELTARMTLVHDGPRDEDRAQAEAAVSLAAAALREAEARLDKTMVRSPIAGVVLRREVRVGETVSADRPASPIFIVADLSRLRVRVEVDEADVARLAVGAPAWVSAAAYGDRRFPGRVIRIGRSLGRKRLFTEEPRERIDTKVLETLVELDPGVSVPVGLRVDAIIGAGR
jgi:HlyD family secretion protein